MTIADYYLDSDSFRSNWLMSNGIDCDKIRAFIIAELKDNEDSEIPLVLINDITGIHDKDKKKFIAPILSHPCAIKRRQLPPILKDFTIRLRPGYTVQKVITDKGDIYYGGWGLILDENMDPLYMESLTIRNKEINNYNAVPLSMYPLMAVGITFRISPKVFTETGLVHKAISKNFIAGIAAHEYTGLSKVQLNLASHKGILKKNIIISDDNPFIIKPVMPKSININKELNDLLKSAYEQKDKEYHSCRIQGYKI